MSLLADVITYLMIVLLFLWVWYLSIEQHQKAEKDSRTSFNTPEWLSFILSLRRGSSVLSVGGLSGQLAVVTMIVLIIQYYYNLPWNSTLDVLLATYVLFGAITLVNYVRKGR